MPAIISAKNSFSQSAPHDVACFGCSDPWASDEGLELTLALAQATVQLRIRLR